MEMAQSHGAARGLATGTAADAALLLLGDDEVVAAVAIGAVGSVVIMNAQTRQRTINMKNEGGKGGGGQNGERDWKKHKGIHKYTLAHLHTHTHTHTHTHRGVVAHRIAGTHPSLVSQKTNTSPTCKQKIGYHIGLA